MVLFLEATSQTKQIQLVKDAQTGSSTEGLELKKPRPCW